MSPTVIQETQTRGDSLTPSPTALQWELPPELQIPPDQLRARLDFYDNSIMLFLIEKGIITTRHVSPDDVATSLLSIAHLKTGILPRNTLWYTQKDLGTETAIYEPPQIRRLAVVTKPLEPPIRFKIPLPGLIFICSPRTPPKVWAVKTRPTNPGSQVFNAPFFNLYSDGTSCAGTHSYPEKIAEIPEAFFISYFTLFSGSQRSKRHPDSLFKLWEELDGQKKYPTDDLVHFGMLGDILK